MPANLLIALLSFCIAVLFVGEAGILRAIVAGFSFLRRMSHRGTIRYDANTILKSPLAPSISVITAPPDASPASLQSVRDLVKMHYGEHEVLVVLDGPSETELGVWMQEFRLFPSSRGASGEILTKPVVGVYESRDPFRLMVIEKERGGLADCLNVGLNVAGAQLVAVADPRSRVTPETMLRVVLPFLEQPDATIAACTMVPPPGEGGMVARFHALEALRLWLGRSAGLASRGVMLPAPGTFSVIDRRALREAHGFASGVLEMIFHLHALFRTRRRVYNIEWVNDDLVSPLPPKSLGELREATLADQREVRRTVWRHLATLGSLQALGRVAMPGMIVTGVARPFIETLAYVLAVVGLAKGTIQWQMAGILVLVTCVFGTFNSMLAVLLREFSLKSNRDADPLLRLFLSTIPENFGYRQLRNLWLLGGLFTR